MDPQLPRDLDGQTAVVTGSSSGIGRAIALELARAGADVVVHARKSAAAAADVARQIGDGGGSARIILSDLATVEGQDALLDQAWQWRDRVDIWINNAGADILTGEAAGWTVERKLAALLQIDVTATIRLGRLAGARMKAAGGGTIVNIGWDGAWRGMGGETAELYAAAKGAVMAFTRSLAQSLAPEVRVNCVAPGWIKTAWGQQASDRWQDRARRESLLRRWGTPEEVAARRAIPRFAGGRLHHGRGDQRQRRISLP